MFFRPIIYILEKHIILLKGDKMNIIRKSQKELDYLNKKRNLKNTEIRLMSNTEFKRRIQRMNINGLNNLWIIFYTRGLAYLFPQKWNILNYHMQSLM